MMEHDQHKRPDWSDEQTDASPAEEEAHFRDSGTKLESFGAQTAAVAQSPLHTFRAGEIEVEVYRGKVILRRGHREVHFEPGVEREWDEFRENADECSIAVDGYVIGPTRRDWKKKVISFNHHQGSDQDTPSSQRQLFDEITGGLFDVFYHEDKQTERKEPKAKLYINHIDEDTLFCAAFLLAYEELQATGMSNGEKHRLLRAIRIEDQADRTGGLDGKSLEMRSPFLEEFCWIFDEFYTRRAENGSSQLSLVDAAECFLSVAERLPRFTTKEGDAVKLDANYREISRATDWIMVEDQGHHARAALFYEGWNAVAIVERNSDGVYKYKFALNPQYRDDLNFLFDYLNDLEAKKREKLGIDMPDQFGGRSNIGGSPQLTDSYLEPGEVGAALDWFFSLTEEREQAS